MALRIGQLKSSSLIAKKVAAIRIVLCASPKYLKDNGTPPIFYFFNKQKSHIVVRTIWLLGITLTT